MKYTELIIGIIIFAGVLSVMLTAAGTIGEYYGSNDAGEYTQLSKNYNDEYVKLGSDKEGALKQIQNKLDVAEFSVVSAAVGAIDAVLQGAKLLVSSIATVENVGSQIGEDTEGAIPPIVFTIIYSIIGVVLTIILLTIFIKMKPET